MFFNFEFYFWFRSVQIIGKVSVFDVIEYKVFVVKAQPRVHFGGQCDVKPF